MNKKELLSRYLLDNTSKNNINEQFQASGLDRRALGLIKNKDKSDLKNIIRSVVFELADDGYDEGDIQDFLGLIVRGEVKMLYKKAVR
tara:strand:+ start:359 stop:622 length:264 start_codon:yes stop_codon:yes gene_type:complete